MANFDSYVICTAPRSGSTLLCQMLTATDVAGAPASYFHRPSVESWAGALDLPPAPAQPEPDRLAAVLQAARRKGAAGTGLFGLRLQAHSLLFFREKLTTLYPDAPHDRDRFHRAFGKTAFIHLRRADKVAQAVSYVIAQKSGLWHRATDGTDIERTERSGALVYDRNEIAACVQTMTGYDDQWQDWFAREWLRPIPVSYEELSAQPGAVLAEVLEALGIAPARADGIAPGVQKLANETNRTWVARYRSEVG